MLFSFRCFLEEGLWNTWLVSEKREKRKRKKGKRNPKKFAKVTKKNHASNFLLSTVVGLRKKRALGMEWRLDLAMLWRAENLLSTLRTTAASVRWSREPSGFDRDAGSGTVSRWIPLDEESVRSIEILHEDLKRQVLQACLGSLRACDPRPSPRLPERPQDPTRVLSEPTPISSTPAMPSKHPHPSSILVIDDDDDDDKDIDDKGKGVASTSRKPTERPENNARSKSHDRCGCSFARESVSTKRALGPRKEPGDPKRARVAPPLPVSSETLPTETEARASSYLDGVRDRLGEFLEWLRRDRSVRPNLVLAYHDTVRIVGYEGRRIHPNDIYNVGASAAFKAFGRFLRHNVYNHAKPRLETPERGPWTGCPIVQGFRRWLVERRSASEDDAERFSRMVQRIKYNMTVPTAAEIRNGAAFAFSEFDRYQNETTEVLMTYAQSSKEARSPSPLLPTTDPPPPPLPPPPARDGRMSLSLLVNAEADA